MEELLSDEWDLSDLFPDDSAWQREFLLLPTPAVLRGELDAKLKGLNSAENVIAFLDKICGLWRKLEKLSAYAQLRHDADMTDMNGVQLQNKIYGPKANLGEIFHQYEKCVLQLSNLSSWVGDGELKHHTIRVKRLLEKFGGKETGDDASISVFRKIMTLQREIHREIISSAVHFSFLIEKSTGEHLEVNPNSILAYQYDKSREIREKAILGFHAACYRHRLVFGAAYKTFACARSQLAQSFGFSSSLHFCGFEEEAPGRFCDEIVSAIPAFFPFFRRVAAHKKAKLGFITFEVFDRTAPLSEAQVDVSISKELGVELILESLSPLGEKYVERLRRGVFTERWVNFSCNSNKASTNYAFPCFDSNPHVLLNWDGSWNSLATLTHELGHAMHYVLSAEKQNYSAWKMPECFPEIPAVFHEILLFDFLSAQEKYPVLQKRSREYKIELLESMFLRLGVLAVFEEKVRERIEEGEDFATEEFGEMYSGLLNEVYGENLNVIPEETKWEWCSSSLPYLSTFYSWKYPAGFLCAFSLCEWFRREPEKARETYLECLAAGGSLHGGEILVRLGLVSSQERMVESGLMWCEKAFSEMRQGS
jgi:oligoendopeptidase F